MDWKDDYKKNNNPKVTKENSEIVIQEYVDYLNSIGISAKHNKDTNKVINEGEIKLKNFTMKYYPSQGDRLRVCSNSYSRDCFVYLNAENEYVLGYYTSDTNNTKFNIINTFNSYNKDVIDKAFNYIKNGDE